MFFKLLFMTFIFLVQSGGTFCQRQWIPPTTTPAEMWNPYTWYLPYAVAAAEGYRDFFTNAQQITNQLYTQAYATNAFGWGGGGVTPSSVLGGAAGQIGSSTSGGSTNPAGGAVNNFGSAQPVPNMSQGGNGWM